MIYFTVINKATSTIIAFINTIITNTKYFSKNYQMLKKSLKVSVLLVPHSFQFQPHFQYLSLYCKNNLTPGLKLYDFSNKTDDFGIPINPFIPSATLPYFQKTSENHKVF